jgi:hypothetical protein
MAGVLSSFAGNKKRMRGGSTPLLKLTTAGPLRAAAVMAVVHESSIVSVGLLL